MNPIDQIIAYLDGKMSLMGFCENLSHNTDLQEYLEQDVSIPPYTKNGSILLYILNLDTSSASSDINAKDMLSKLLKVTNVDHKVDQSSLRDYEIVLAASPAWLSLPDDYITNLISRLPKNLTRAARSKAAKDLILTDFTYIKKPPKWIQNPSWVFSNGFPAIFVGQLDIGDLSHDNAQV